MNNVKKIRMATFISQKQNMYPLYKRIVLITILVTLVSMLTGCFIVEDMAKDKMNRDRLVEYMENKYGIPFEILNATSDGLRGNSSYNIVSSKYPKVVDFVSIGFVGTPDESIYEEYAFRLFQSDWERYYALRIKEFMGSKAYIGYAQCQVNDEMEKLFKMEKVDLDALSFKQLGESGGGMVDSVSARIIFIRDISNENYDAIYEELLVWFKHLRDLGVKSVGIQVLGFAEASLQLPKITELKQKVDENNGYGAGTLQDAMMNPDNGVNYIVYGSGFPESLDLKHIETIEDIKKTVDIRTYK